MVQLVDALTVHCTAATPKAATLTAATPTAATPTSAAAVKVSNNNNKSNMAENQCKVALLGGSTPTSLWAGE